MAGLAPAGPCGRAGGPHLVRMDIAHPLPDPTAHSVARDRARVRYALIGAGALLAGIWIAWLAAWLLGWPLNDLGVRPRQIGGLIGADGAVRARLVRAPDVEHPAAWPARDPDLVLLSARGASGGAAGVAAVRLWRFGCSRAARRMSVPAASRMA